MIVRFKIVRLIFVKLMIGKFGMPRISVYFQILICIVAMPFLAPSLQAIESDAKIIIEYPNSSNSKIKKQVFHLDAFKTLDCPLKKNLDKNHKDFIGEWVHVESRVFATTKKKVSVSTDNPLMLSGLYSNIAQSGNSNICYYQSQSFWPQSNQNYLIRFKNSCEVEGFQLLPSGQQVRIKLNNLLDTCFKQ